MEKINGKIGYMVSRQDGFKRSFKFGTRALLTACSKEEFCNAFPRFTQAEQERLHRLYIQVISSLHMNIQDEFEVLCQETEVGKILNTIEELVEEQTMDPLYPDETNLKDVAQDLSTLKKNEIQNLSTMLEKPESQNRVLRNRVELLKNEIHGASNALEKANKEC